MNNRKGSADTNFLAFQLEAEILRRIAHPRIPGFVEAFSFGDTHYIVEKFIAGLPLSHLLDSGYRFSEAAVKGFILQLLSIANDLHCPPRKENAVVHRDLRLSNLLLQNDKLYLIDFGLARFLDPSQFAFCPDPPGSISGDSSVLARALPVREDQLPSQKIPGVETYRLLRREVSPRSDLFGTGVVAVDLFTNWVEDESHFRRPWEKVLPLSGPFVVFLKKLLSRQSAFETAAEALEYLKALP